MLLSYSMSIAVWLLSRAMVLDADGDERARRRAARELIGRYQSKALG
jgi:hypothetical protein